MVAVRVAAVTGARMTFNLPLTRAEILNAIDEDYHSAANADDNRPASLAASLLPVSPLQAPPTAPVPHTAPTYGLVRDREAAALLSELVAWAW